MIFASLFTMGKVAVGRDIPKNDAPNSIAGLVLGLVLGNAYNL
jgi:hypothetical protein